MHITGRYPLSLDSVLMPVNECDTLLNAYNKLERCGTALNTILSDLKDFIPLQESR